MIKRGEFGDILGFFGDELLDRLEEGLLRLAQLPALLVVLNELIEDLREVRKVVSEVDERRKQVGHSIEPLHFKRH